MKAKFLLFSFILIASSIGLESCVIEGCTDEDATNYESAANSDDGSCEYIEGCTISTATNYNSSAGLDDGSCTFEAMFWTDADYGVGSYINVYVQGAYVGAITSYYSSGTPDCGSSGCVNITRPAGTYSFTATAEDGTNWNSTITISETECSTMRLYVSKEGEAKASEELHETNSGAVENVLAK